MGFYGHVAPQGDARSQMHVITDATIMLHYGTGIEDAIVADNGIRIHHDPGHYNSTAPDANRTRDKG